jgi:hypothetical protein
VHAYARGSQGKEETEVLNFRDHNISMGTRKAAGLTWKMRQDRDTLSQGVTRICSEVKSNIHPIPSSTTISGETNSTQL